MQLLLAGYLDCYIEKRSEAYHKIPLSFFPYSPISYSPIFLQPTVSLSYSPLEYPDGRSGNPNGA